MVGPIDVKRKGGASVGCWVNYVTLTFDLIHDVWFLKVKFQNSCIWGIVIWLMWNKRKANQILGWLYGLALWPHPWPLRLKVKVWNSLIWGTGVEALIDMERKGCESIIHDHDCDLWVTMVGWVDVLYSDFRRRRAADISSKLSWCTGFYTKGRPLLKSNLICPSDKLSWQPGCPVLNINIHVQGNFCISQGNGS